jgi:hypothetical protein
MLKPKCDRILGAFLAIALISSFFSSPIWAANQGPGSPDQAQSQRIGEVRRIQGTVLMRQAGGNNSFRPIKEHTPIGIEDTVETKQASKAWCVLSTQPSGPSNEAHASLGENSSLEFIRFDQNGETSIFSAGEGQGLIRYIKKLPQTNPPSSFSIITPTAIIEVLPSDRAADFVVEVVRDDLITVYGIWGAVKVRNISPQFKQERIVTSCQKVDVQRDKEPSPVMGVGPDKLLELIKRTTIPNTLPEDVPSCKPQATGEYFGGPPYVGGPPAGGCPCPPGEELIGNYCRRCPYWKMYDPYTCGCVPRCRDNYNCSRCDYCRDGRCVPKVCPPGEWLDRDTCRCRRRCPQNVLCKLGYWFNPKTCRCEKRCEIRKCPRGQWLDQEHCRCVTGPIPKCNKTCPMGQTLDPRTCTCKPKCTTICPTNEWLDYNTCQCKPRCERTCPKGYQLDRKRCTCRKTHECDLTCPRGQRLDRANCRCVNEPIPKKEGCRSDSDCGPGSVCHNGRCVTKKEHHEPIYVKPRPKHKPESFEHPIEPIHPINPTHPIHPINPGQPSRPGLPFGRQLQGMPGQQIH